MISPRQRAPPQSNGSSVGFEKRYQSKTFCVPNCANLATRVQALKCLAQFTTNTALFAVSNSCKSSTVVNVSREVDRLSVGITVR
jgi:hypothetical protein